MIKVTLKDGSSFTAAHKSDMDNFVVFMDDDFSVLSRYHIGAISRIEEI